MSEIIGPFVCKPGFDEAEMNNGAVKSFDRYGKLAARIEVLEQEKKMLIENYEALNKKCADLKAAFEQLCQRVAVPGEEKREIPVQDQIKIAPSVLEKISKSESACLGLPGMIWNSGKINKKKIAYVVFLDSLNLKPNDAWDVSDAGNQSVMAWIENTCTLYLAAQGGVKANKNCAHLFEGCEKLREIKFGGNFDTSETVNMRQMFFDCRNLIKLDMTGMHTANVTNTSSMFEGCEKLREIKFGETFDTSSIVDMSGMFCSCKSLTQLDISSFNTSNVKNMSYMFYDCESLTKLNMTGIVASGTTKTGDMFWHCVSLQELETTSFSILLEWDVWDKAQMEEVEKKGFIKGKRNYM